MPVEVIEVAFEGNFVNVHAVTIEGGVHMVQVQNDPSGTPPRARCQDAHGLPADHAVVLRRGTAAAAPEREPAPCSELLRRYGMTLTAFIVALTAFWLLALVVAALL